MEVNPVEHQPAIRHFGIYRPVTTAEARLDGATLRTLWRRDSYNEGMGEGLIANYVRQRVGAKMWVACLQRLHDWQMVDIVAGYYGDARRIELTALGKYWAIELCGERQNAGKTPDGIED